MLSYKNIRSQINISNIVVFSCLYNTVSIAIQLITKNKWYHVEMILKNYPKDIIYLLESITLSDIKSTIDNIFKKIVSFL
jgi:hypothetical protein